MISMLAAIATVSGTAVQQVAQAPQAPGGIKGWIIVAAACVAVPWFFLKAKAWAKTAPHDFLVKAKAKWQAKIEKGEIDADADELVKAVGIAVARYAERRLPDKGLGAERMDLIVRTAKAVPYIGWVVAKYEKDFREFFEIFVESMDAELKEQTGDAQPPK